MSYQVLARKWRPATFHEMRGQEHVLQALVNALDSDRLHHAYLFTGTRGVGKTSVARILAKCLNCETGVSSRPCGKCGACSEISENRFVDLIEVDAASRTKVEDTRELLENVQYAPSKGRFKIYLIDEVHMLSTHSFNALLKTLEEPPPHVKFLLATTDPQRLPATILSRCLQFSLKNIAPEVIVEHLKHVLGAEAVTAEEAALWALARAASGSMRDALSLTDQAIAFSGDGIREADVSSMLGTISRDTVCELIEALAQRDASAVLKLSEQVASNGTDLSLYIEELLSSLHSIAVFQAVPDYQAPQLDSSERLKALAASMLAEDVQLYYQIAVQAQRDLPFAPSPRVGLEMALMRMLTFLADDTDTIEELSTAPAEMAEQAANNSSDPAIIDESAATPAQAAAAPDRAESTPDQSSSVPELPATAISSSTSSDRQAPGVSQVAEAPQASAGPSAAHRDPAATSVLATQAEPQTEKKKPDVEPCHALGPDNWNEVFARLKIAGMARNVAANCELKEAADGHVVFCLDEVNCKLFQATHVAQLESALQNYTGQMLKVTLESGAVGRETPFLHDQRCKRERQQAAVDSIMSDPNVNSLLQTFGGQVEHESIAPIAPKEADLAADPVRRH
ncbi:MAG: DNA polymerase III subunit gamma/tau [Pseudomonadales bacterium]